MLRLAVGAAGRVTGRFVAAPVARSGRPSFAATTVRLFSAASAEQKHADTASWSDADSSTPGGQLTNLQHRYRRVKAPLRALAPLLNACEKPTDLKIAVSAVSLYQQKDCTLKEEQAAHFINTCCRLGHPALAIAALSTGAKGQGVYSAVLNDTDSEPTEIRLPKNLGLFLLQSLNPNAFIPHFDEWGLEARDGNADDVLPHLRAVVALLSEYTVSQRLCYSACRALCNAGVPAEARALFTETQAKGVTLPEHLDGLIAAKEAEADFAAAKAEEEAAQAAAAAAAEAAAAAAAAEESDTAEEGSDETESK